MPVDSSGNYSLPNGYVAVSGQTILASQHNPPLEDIAAALSQVLYRSGAAPFSGSISAAGFKITNAGNGTDAGDYVTKSQMDELSVAASIPAGTVLGFRRTTAPAGWIKENGGTIGNAASGATTRANADTINLYTVLWEQFDNVTLVIQTSAGAPTTRGASAAADFAFGKRMPLFDSRSRFHRGADDGLGYDASLTVGLAQDDMFEGHTHTGTTASSGNHNHTIPRTSDTGTVDTLAVDRDLTKVSTNVITTSTDGAHTHTFTTASTGGSETRPRSSVLLYCIKL